MRYVRFEGGPLDGQQDEFDEPLPSEVIRDIGSDPVEPMLHGKTMDGITPHQRVEYRLAHGPDGEPYYRVEVVGNEP